MNSENLAQLIQKGFHVTIGATATLVESIKNPAQGAETFSRLQTDFYQLTEEWEAKGETAEQEARVFVEQLINNASQSSANSPPSTAARPPAPTATPDVQTDLQELTRQISAIRAELEKLRSEDSQNYGS
jgi:polyhydroxyalkanoate synthesis regulator phasin